MLDERVFARPVALVLAVDLGTDTWLSSSTTR
jgi:hypothetical protein